MALLRFPAAFLFYATLGGIWTFAGSIGETVGLGNPSVTIRGIGVTTFDPVAGNTVATYVDEVPLGSTGQMNFTTFDLERVEVLKGPQGTLFGTGTTAGVIQFVSKRPTDVLEITARAGAANYGNFFGEAVVSGPLGENVAGRISLRADTSDGFFHNLATGRDAGGADTIQVRTQLLWQPDGGTVLLKGYYSRSDGRSNLYDYVPLLDPKARRPISARRSRQGLPAGGCCSATSSSHARAASTPMVSAARARARSMPITARYSAMIRRMSSPTMAS